MFVATSNVKMVNAVIEQVRKAYPDLEIDESQFVLPLTQLTLEMSERIEENSASEKVQAFFALVNQLSNEIGDRSDLIEVAILEPLTDTKATQLASFKYLKGFALASYTRLFDFKFVKLV